MKRIIALILSVMMVATLFVGCGKKDNNTDGGNGEIPTITWYAVGGGMPANYDDWTKEVNAYLEEKIGVHLDYQCVPWGDWDDRHNAIVSTNEPYDIMFTNDNTYASEVSMGAFADITELLNETPGLKDVIPSDVWDGCAINGKVYAVPTYKDCAMQNFAVWKKDSVEKYFPDWENAHDIDTIEVGLKAIHDAGENAYTMMRDGINLYNYYDNMGTGLPTLGVSFLHEGNEAPKVVSVFEQPDVMDGYKRVHGWMNDGIINSDAAVTKEATGEYGFGIAQGWPSAIGIWSGNRGYDCVCTTFQEPLLSRSNVQGSLNCISATSKHKVEALKLLELANTDNKFRDMLAYGQEGVNFKYVEEEGMQKVQRDLDHPWTFAGYTQATFFDMSTEAGTTGNYWVDEVKVQNEKALKSPVLGFYFNPEKVNDQLDACRSIFMEYKASIQTGTSDPEVAIPEMMNRMRESGFDEIVTECQSQLDAWWAESHK